MKKLSKTSIISSLGLALGLIASGSASAQSACSVSYTSGNSWGSGAQVSVAATNNGAAVSSWELCWTFSGNETISNIWDGVAEATGKNVCVKNASYNGNL